MDQDGDRTMAMFIRKMMETEPLDSTGCWLGPEEWTQPKKKMMNCTKHHILPGAFPALHPILSQISIPANIEPENPDFVEECTLRQSNVAMENRPFIPDFPQL